MNWCLKWRMTKWNWAKKLIPIMENAIKLSVPVRVEAKVGDNWGEMDKLERWIIHWTNSERLYTIWV